ncbi:MAG: hypothetical protein A2096_02420 [Spirochaetes bacterium GWF1_41_5]|nr:MAG: hypothetical protein A2096_02420 [Spirochaetes bacterium GWF1_41_5]
MPHVVKYFLRTKDAYTQEKKSYPQLFYNFTNFKISLIISIYRQKPADLPIFVQTAFKNNRFPGRQFFI